MECPVEKNRSEIDRDKINSVIISIPEVVGMSNLEWQEAFPLNLGIGQEERSRAQNVEVITFGNHLVSYLG